MDNIIADNVMITIFVSDSIPDGIAADPNLQKIFYTDQNYSLIASIDYNGNNHETILTSTDNLLYPRAIVLDVNTRFVLVCLEFISILSVYAPVAQQNSAARMFIQILSDKYLKALFLYSFCVVFCGATSV